MKPSRAARKAARGRERRRPGWLCDGHGHWISPGRDLHVASEARKLGAPVPFGELDPEEGSSAQRKR